MRKIIPLALVVVAFAAIGCKKEETAGDKVDAGIKKVEEGAKKVEEATKTK